MESEVALSNLRLHDPDNHAPFMHYIQSTNSGTEFVICVQCKHWIERVAEKCKCSMDCHGNARDLLLESQTRKR